MPDLNDARGSEPANNAPTSYDGQLEADIRAAFDTVEKGANDAPAPADKGSDRQYNRDEGGRFAKKEGDEAAGAESSKDKPAAEPEKPASQPVGEAVEAPAEEPAQEPAAPAVASPVGSPPPGWSVKSKSDWDGLSAAFPHIAADIVKREGEVAQGLAALRDYKDLKPYAEMARQSGTTLSAALQRFTTMETALRQDPAHGLMAIVHNAGLSQQRAAQLFADLAARLGAPPHSAPQSNGARPPASLSNGTRPPTIGSDQNDPLVEILGPLLEQRIGPLEQRLDERLGPVAQKLSALENHMTAVHLADQKAMERSVTEAIERFAADPAHRYFPDLEETISRLFETGMVERTADTVADLGKAYEMAAQLHPEVREALINERLKTSTAEAKAKEKEASAKAQRASRSITGSTIGATPEPAPNGKRKGVSYEADLEADVRAAMESLTGRA
jgi:hypothetical protein